jgi:peptidoglycan/LPS O-acetylase OafA/YrhL
MAAEPSGRAADAGVAAGSYLPELESLRGIAILLVFWFHVEGILFLPYRRPQVVDLRGRP